MLPLIVVGYALVLMNAYAAGMCLEQTIKDGNILYLVIAGLNIWVAFDLNDTITKLLKRKIK